MPGVDSADVPGRFGISFFILLVVHGPQRSLDKFSEQNLDSQPSGGVQIPREWIGKLAKTTRMTKIQNSHERSKTGFPGRQVVIFGDLRRVMTIPDGKSSSSIQGYPRFASRSGSGNLLQSLKSPIWAGAAGSRVASIYVRSWVHFFILLVVQDPQRHRGKVSEQNSHFQPSGEVQIPQGVDQKAN